ncbi:uncharacterized protein LOC108204208 [Daucus carota subsp. sativus]|uniref:uncharacterized protein LOC108204208 n=1 Tax=Daucus carota subsp. sativus TaxID=79200 RepID=UPI0007EFBC2C|nr:PREDICTED: uncharacterized protein LOC108204208 [Daucus carota subsp. sativus]XP_017256609.1 PREDICTED: uncharacterized protein LOC108226178 [Daucus carota subsp. sativus]
MADTGNAWNIHNRTVLPQIQDQSSIYYIHPSDYTSSQVVSVKFNGNGFTNWKRSMVRSLISKNKFGFVDGSVAKPDTNSPDFKAWERCNTLVCTWLIANLDETIAGSVMCFSNAIDIWCDLEDRFGFATMAQVYAVEQQLTDVHQGSKSVSEFYTEIRTLWDELSDASPLAFCTCNKCVCNVNQRIRKKEQERRLIQFMMKLADKFSTIRGNILMQQPLPPIANAFKLFSQEERHQEIAQLSSNTESLAFLADNKKTLDHSQQSANSAYSGTKPNSVAKRNSKYYCTHCKIAGHSIERCFKINGYPPGFKGFKDKKMAAMSSSNASNDDTAHITNAQYQ